jgi:predicted Zn-ribbon and HTH transcriptional regulator
MNNLTNDDYENAPRLLTEYRRVLIIQCPDCPNEYEENDCAIAEQAINQCPKCKFIWVNEL